MEAEMPIFLKLDGIEGDSTDASHVGWFEVDNFSFGVTTPTNGATGGASGRSHFTPLAVDIHSITGFAALLGAELDHKTFKSVELVETTDGGPDQRQAAILDIKLTNVSLSELLSSPGSGAPEESLALNYGKISVTYHPQNPDGSFGQPQTFTSSVPSSGTPVPPLVVHEAEVTPVPPGSPVHYFLKVAGVTGDSRDAAHPGWFTVDGFDFGATTPTSAGLPNGRAHISPLLVDIHSITGLAALLGYEVTNWIIPSVELVGVEGFEKEQQTVYDLKLTNVSLDGLHDEPGAQGVEADLAFTFEHGSLTQGDTTTAFGASRGAAAAPPALSEVSAVPAQSPVQYFLKVAGVTGDSTDARHPGWFTVDGFDFGITTPTTAGSGQATGRSQVSPLLVDIHSITGLAALLGDEATNRVIQSVELVGVENGGKEQQTIYDLTLTHVQLDGLHNEPGAQGVEADLAFTFGHGSLTQGDTTTAFGASRGAAAAIPAVQDTGVTAVPASSLVEYFLKIDGVTGDSRDAAHPGWFTVDGLRHHHADRRWLGWCDRPLADLAAVGRHPLDHRACGALRR
jgi:type VI secretion system secreted protein Hcp